MSSASSRSPIGPQVAVTSSPPTPVKRAAQPAGLRVFEPPKLKPFVEDARALGADAFVVASYGKIVPQALLDVVPIAFNVHPSLLPLYRGATPIQSAIRDGRSETGVTIIAMDAGMDTGDVLVQERTPIGPAETYGELHDRLALRGAELAVDALGRFANGTLAREPQSEVARRLGIGDDEIAVTATRPLHKGDLDIDWSRTPRGGRRPGAFARARTARAHDVHRRADQDRRGARGLAGDAAGCSSPETSRGSAA